MTVWDRTLDGVPPQRTPLDELIPSCETCQWGGFGSIEEYEDPQRTVICHHKGSKWYNKVIARGYSKHDRCGCYEAPPDEMRAFLVLGAS